MNAITAVLIDPFTRTVSHIQLEGDTNNPASHYHAFKGAVFGDTDDRNNLLQHINVGAGHGLYCDEEGLLKPWDEQAFFKLGDDLIIAGKAIVVRDTPDGWSESCAMPIATITRPLAWLDAKDVRVPAPFMETMGPDGDVKKELLAGVEYWDYNNQPG
jgi:hypothetical protein